MRRCFVVTRSYVSLVICGLGAAVSFVSGVAGSVGLIAAKYYTRTWMVLPQATTWLIATAAKDVAISAVLIVKLRKTRTTFRSTERIVSKVVRLAFETASLTAIVATINTILFAGYGKENSGHLFFQLYVGKMYTHSVMVTLLARSKLRRDSGKNDGIHDMSDSVRWRYRHKERSKRSSVAGGVSVTTVHIIGPSPNLVSMLISMLPLPKRAFASRIRLR